jgi:hypothetical protein
VGACIDEGRGIGRRFIRQQQRSAPHAETDRVANLTQYGDRTGDHAGAAIVADAAFYQDCATTQPVAHPITRVTLDQHHTAAHPLRLACHGGAQEIVRIAVDLDIPVAQSAGAELCAVPPYVDAAATHVAPEIRARVTLDVDLAGRHASANTLKAWAGVTDYNGGRIIAAHLEQFCHGYLPPTRPQCQATDIL